MSYANRVLGSIPFGTLIGSPMTAAVEAQALAAQSSIDFIRSVGFTSDDEDEQFGEVRNVTFSYKSRDTSTGADQDVELVVPILTIVPIPYLRIDDMTIDFTSKITEELVRKSTRKGEVATKSELSVGYKSFFSPVKVSFKGSVSTKHTSTASAQSRYKTEHTIKINVKAVQDDIPGGMGRVLDLLESAITNPNEALPPSP
ncbi:DUF2589 domain-containing protein [Vibrio parahaemolyticus]|uniref:DUF2589 domain-containing protein n=1 Tax=Vibrio mediterranei TaxID=689 RepID=UPI0040693183